MGKYLAVDLGAESGRVVVGHLESGSLRLEELHRFPNGPVQVHDSLYWDVLGLWREIKHGLAAAAKVYRQELVSVGVDTWGVDYALLAGDDSLLQNPFHYRDSRTNGMMEAAFARVPRREIYERTGIQFMQINSLFQLFSMVKSNSPLLASASAFLTMPDLFHFWLSGRKAIEFSIATTTQCYDPRAGDWAYEMLEGLAIPGHLFGEVIPPGTVLGRLSPVVAGEIGLEGLQVITPAAHDTASAVAAVPAVGKDYIYISSGTWSLAGVVVDQPIISQESLDFNFTNEGGLGGTFRFLQNIMGLWLVQECRRTWEQSGQEYSYAELTEMAAAAPPFGALVIPSDPRFLPPGEMPSRIQDFCRDTGQDVPETRGAVVRCALESLALAYRVVAEQLESLVGRTLPVIHIIGGGSQNQLLNQLTAEATSRTVVAGPVEATSIGNLMVQALAAGELGSLEAGKKMVRDSFEVTRFEPTGQAGWEEAYQRYLSLLERNQD